MDGLKSLIPVQNMGSAMLVAFAVVLLLILIISFRSRSVVFCQYLRAMTGVSLKPADVKRCFKEKGRDGVRELFLDLIIREDLKEGPIQIADEPAIHQRKKPAVDISTN